MLSSLVVWGSCLELGVEFNYQTLRYSTFINKSFNFTPRKRKYYSKELSSFHIKLTFNDLRAARNLGTFESKRPTVQTIISKIKTRICHRINAAFNLSPRPEFLKSWAHRTVLFSYISHSPLTLISYFIL